MSYCFNLEAGTGIIHIRFSGELSDSTMMEAYPEIRQIVTDHNVRAGIIDFSGVTEVRLSSDCVRFLAHNRPMFPDPIPRVIVAPEELIYGISRMYQELGSRTRGALHVARSLEEAYELLAESQNASTA